MTNEKMHFVETLSERTKLFQIGTEQVIWGISLNTIDVDSHEVDEYLADGWYAHPFEARDAQAALEQQRAEQAAEAQRIKDKQEEDERKRLQDLANEEAERTRLKKQADADADADNALKETLLTEAEKLGVKVDKRWGTKTLQEAIDEAKKAK